MPSMGDGLAKLHLAKACVRREAINTLQHKPEILFMTAMIGPAR